MSASSQRTCSQAGSGLLGSLFGLGIIMTLLGLAVNVALGLWTRSTVDSIAYDAARYVATTPRGADSDEAASDALRDARATLGGYGRRVRMRFEQTGDPVVLAVRAPGIDLLPRVLGRAPTVGAIDRRIILARESGW
jgi:hypothetical protein